MRESRIPELGTARARELAALAVSGGCSCTPLASPLQQASTMTRLVLLLLLAAGCEKDLLADLPDAGVAVDAQTRCSAPTADANAAAKYTLYLNFDGVTLTPCRNPDARTNCSNLVQADTTFPPFMIGNPDRDGFISSIASNVRDGVAPYSIDVVTTRPAAGNYYMIVVGGTPDLVGATPDTAGQAPHSCIIESFNLVSIDFDFGEQRSSFEYASSFLSDLAMFASLPATSGPPEDCACRNCIYSADAICSFGAASPVVTDPHGCGQTIADEPAMLKAVFGCR
jgi:hypothetical protein